MNPDVKFILIAMFGAFCQEVIYWFNQRNKLGGQESQNLIRSSQYWVITILMITVSGVGAWILYGQKEIPRDLQFILGAAFPLIFKQLVSGLSEKRALAEKRVKLGHGDKTKEVLNAYFQ